MSDIIALLAEPPSSWIRSGLVENPILMFALLLAALALAPILARRMGLPEVVLLPAFGILLGSHGLNLLAINGEALRWLGLPGLLYIMFLSGLETSVFDLMRSRRRVTAFGILTFIVPAIFGMASGRLLLGMNWPASILLGAVLASHTLIAWPVVSRFGLSRHGFATATVGGTVLNNFAAMLILAIIVGQAGGGSDLMFWVRLAALSLGFAVLVFWILPAVSRFFLRNTSPDDGSQVIYILTMVFTAAFLCRRLASNRFWAPLPQGWPQSPCPGQEPLDEPDPVSRNSLLVLFFLLSIGFLSDLGQLTDPTPCALPSP